MQKLFNILSFLFLAIRYRKKADPIKIMSKMISIKKSSINNIKIVKPKILVIAPIRVSPMSNLFEGLIGYYFKLKGWTVRALMCDQSVHYCDNITHTDEKRRKAICALCKKEQDRFCDTFGFEKISIKNSIKKDDLRNIDTFIAQVNNLEDLTFLGYNLSNSVRSGVTRYLLRSDSDWNLDREVIKGYIRTAAITLCALRNEIGGSVKVDRIILSHGVYSQWGSVSAFAEKEGIQSFVWARGYVGQGSLIFGKGCSYLQHFIQESKEIYQSLSYSEQDMDEVMAYFSAKKRKNSNVDFINYYDSINTKKTDQLQLDEVKSKYVKVIGMFTNIPWDGQIYNATPEFSNTEVYLKTVISWFVDNPDVALIIRSHPAEVDIEEGRGSEKISDILKRILPNGLPTNIYFVQPSSIITSYDVLKYINAAVVYGSTMGLEIAISKIPVIQAGLFYTSGKEFVFEARNTNSLHCYLSQCKAGMLEMSNIQIINARKFACYWILVRHINDDTVELENLEFRKFKFENLEEFINNDTMRHIFERISDSKDIVNSRFLSDFDIAH